VTVAPVFERVASDVPWDPVYLDLQRPERVITFADFGPGAEGAGVFSRVAVTSPFRILNDEGLCVLQAVCRELEAFATESVRIPKRMRGGVYRSNFLRGLVSDPELLSFVRELAQAPLEPHPVFHHAAHLNYAPDDLRKHVDQWHYDSVSFDIVMMVTDPRGMKGGRFEYFHGPVEEGVAILEEGRDLPPERVVSVEFPGPGWCILQQGHRVLHRATRLEEPGERITLVASFWTPDPALADPTDLRVLLKADGRDVALVEWSRYAALVAARRLERFAAEEAVVGRPVGDVRDGLSASLVEIEQALSAFEQEDGGTSIFFPVRGEGEAERSV
jgi:hypothetical protein